MNNKKYCIFDNNKLCNNCKECCLCDLDKNKICDSCGKCLNLSDEDMKTVKINEIFDDIKTDFQFIEDVCGLSHILKENNGDNKNIQEIFPGLIRLDENS